MLLLIILLIIMIICLYKCINKRKKHTFTGSKVLVLGGSSGLGLSISRILKRKGASVTIASRNPTKYEQEFSTFTVDVTDASTFNCAGTDFDYIFSCAGAAISDYFMNLTYKDHTSQMSLNYFGTLYSLVHYFKCNKKPFSFIMIGSTVSFYTFPGYSAYSPSKAALRSFFDSVFLEMKYEGVDLYIFFANTMDTRGYEKENHRKPEFTKWVEGDNGESPDKCAAYLLEQMSYRNIIDHDRTTQMLRVRSEATRFSDYVLLLSSIFIYPVWRLIFERVFMRFYKRARKLA